MDLNEIERILRLVESSGIDELEVEEGGTRIRVKKFSGTSPAVAVETNLPIPSVPTAPPPPQPSQPEPREPEGGTGLHEVTTITSPMVGTFYRAPSPDSPPFVQIGSEVDPDTVVCILEAMKVMNEIKAGCRGKITEILVENAQAVEFGQPLFKVAVSS